jgi:hypothetical protein
MEKKGLKIIKSEKKSRLKEIISDLRILKLLPKEGSYRYPIQELEKATGINWDNELLPLLIRHSLFQHTTIKRDDGDNKYVAYKIRELPEVIKNLEDEREKIHSWQKENSWWHNPVPWVLVIGTSIISFLIGKYYG